MRKNEKAKTLDEMLKLLQKEYPPKPTEPNIIKAKHKT